VGTLVAELVVLKVLKRIVVVIIASAYASIDRSIAPKQTSITAV